MIILDTDALSHMQKRDSVGFVIESMLNASPDRVSKITIVTAYEMFNGAMSLVARRMKEHGDVVRALDLLEQLVQYLATWKDQILLYDSRAEQVYRNFPARLRQELKADARIATVALVNGAAIWTCNIRDYSRVPGLMVFDARTGSEVI